MSEQRRFACLQPLATFHSTNALEHDPPESLTSRNNKLKENLCSSKITKDKAKVTHRTKIRTKTRLMSKLFWLGLLVLVPIYLPYIVVQVAMPTPSEPSNYDQNSSAPSTFIINQYYRKEQSEQVDLLQIERSIDKLLEDRFKASYHNQHDLMNVASLKAGTAIQQLDCTPKKSRFFWPFGSLWNSKSDQANECQDLISLIDEKSRDGWHYPGKTGTVYLEFRERAKIYAIGIEIYKWESKKFISGKVRIQAKGVNPVEGKNLQHNKLVVDLIDNFASEVAAAEEFEDKIRYYFECRVDQCFGTYHGLMLEFSTINKSSTSPKIQKIFVFEKF